MKRKIFSIMLFLFVGFLLSGCDLFGPGTSTTTTTEATTVTTTTTSGTTTTTTTQPTTQSTTTTQTSTTTTTQATTTTTTTTTQTTTTQTTTQTTTTQTTTTQVSYTVTFYNADGTVLNIQSVVAGAGAVAPPNPTMPATAEYTYAFLEWDTDFSNITGNTSVTAVYTETYVNRQDLINLVVMMFDPDDPEEMIDEMVDLMGMTGEPELYGVLLFVVDMMEDLPTISSAADIHSLYASMGTNGITRERIINLMHYAMLQGMTNDLSYYNEEIAQLQQQIVDETAHIADYELQKTAIENEVAAYCQLQIGVQVECQNYFDALVNILELQIQYQHMFDNEQPEGFDYYLWWNLEWRYDYYLQLSINGSDPEYVQDALDDFNNLWNDLSSQEQGWYQPFLDKLIAFKTAQYTNDNVDYSMLYVTDTGGEHSVMGYLDMKFYGFWDEFDNETYGFEDYVWNIDFSQWLILEAQWRIEERERDLIRTTAIVALLQNSENEVKTGFGTIYDFLEAMILQLDEDTFDFVYDNMMSMMMGSEISVVLMSEENDPSKYLMDLLTPENLVFIADKITDLLSAGLLTLDTADYTNAGVLALGFIEEMMIAQEVPPLDQIAVLADMALVIDRYIGYFQFASAELVDFLETIDLEKAEAILSIQEFFKFEGIDEIFLAVKISKIADELIGDGSLDVSTILQYLAAIYFDATNDFDPDPTYVSSIQTQINTFIVDYLSLIAQVKDYDPMIISPEEVEDVYDLIARTKAIGWWFISGFEAVEDPVVPYNEELMVDFLMRMFYPDDVPGMISMMMGILGTPDNETTFYYMRSILQYGMSIMYIRDFGTLQYWVDNLESFGFTQAELVGYLMQVLDIASQQLINGSADWNDYMDYLEGEIADYQSQIGVWEGQLNDIDAAIAANILLLDIGLQTDANTYWSTLIEFQIINMHLNNAFNEMYWYFGDVDADAFIPIIEALVDADNADPFDQTTYDDALDAYNALYDSFEYDEHAQWLLENYLFQYDTYVSSGIQDAWDAIELTILNNGDYAGFIGFVNMNREQYINLTLMIENLNNQIAYYQEEIEHMYEELRPFEVLFGLMDDPTLYDETEEVINILLDRIQYMITTMPDTSFSILDRIIMKIEKHDDEFDFTAQEIYTFTQELSAFLKLRDGSLPISVEDQATLEQFILDVITLFVGTMDLDPLDEADMITYINTLVLKYIDFADLALTEVTDFLDSLDESDVQMIMDFAMMIAEESTNQFSLVVIGAQVIDTVLDPAVFDIHLLANMMNEVYYDIVYQTYDPLDLAALQDAWETYIDTVLLSIEQVAALDPDNLDPLTFAQILELQQQVEYLVNLFVDPEAIFYVPTFGYTHADFVELVYNMFSDVNESNVEDIIADLCAVFDLTTVDEELVYYYIIGIGQSLREIEYVHSITDVMNLLHAVFSFGFTNEELATYFVNALEIFFVPDLPNMYDLTGFQDAMDGWMQVINDNEDYIDEIDDIIAAEINAIDEMTYPGAQAAAWNLWYKYQETIYAEAELEFHLDNVYLFIEWFNWGLWDELCGYVESDDWWSIDNRLYDYDWQTQDTYRWLLGMYQNVYNRNVELDNMYWDFTSTYGYPPVTYRTDLASWIPDLFDAEWNDYSYYQYELYAAYFWYYEAEWQYYDAEESALMFQTLETFFLTPGNDELTEDFLLVVLDQLEAYTTDPNIEVFDFIMSLVGKDPSEIDINMADTLNILGGFMINMLSTIDTEDEIVIVDFVQGMISAYIDTLEIADPVEDAAMRTAYAGFVDDYLVELMDIPAILGTFMQTLTEAKVATILDQFAILNSLPHDEYGLSPEEILTNNYIRAIAIANIIDVLDLDITLDYSGVYTPLIGLIYDINTFDGIVYDDDLATILATLDTTVGNLITSAALIVNVDPYDPSILDKTNIATFKAYVDGLGLLMDSFINPDPVV